MTRARGTTCHYSAVATLSVTHRYAAVRGTRHLFTRRVCEFHLPNARLDGLAWRHDLEREDARDNGADI